MKTPSAAIGWFTVATADQALEMGRQLVQSGLVACTQVSAPITSIYRWDGRLCEDMEYRVTVKFSTVNAQSIQDWLQQHHPYKVPQWIWVQADGIAPAYAAWLMDLPTPGSPADD
jgi:periplasmic divalent cation tolerance protein